MHLKNKCKLIFTLALDLKHYLAEHIHLIDGHQI